MIRVPSSLFYGVLAFFGAERTLELLIHKRNARRLAARAARWYGPRDGFALIVLAQLVLFAGTAYEVWTRPYAHEHRGTWALVVALALAQALRYWAIATLGERWAIRVVTVTDAPRIASGPYRFLPHPNYVAVMVEAIALPLAFGAWWTLAIAAPLQAIALWNRIRVEGSALAGAEQAYLADRES